MSGGHIDKAKIYLDIYYTINFIRKVELNKPSKWKVFSYLKKLNRGFCYDLFDIILDKLVQDKFIVIKGNNDQ